MLKPFRFRWRYRCSLSVFLGAGREILVRKHPSATVRGRRLSILKEKMIRIGPRAIQRTRIDSAIVTDAMGDIQWAKIAESLPGVRFAISMRRCECVVGFNLKIRRGTIPIDIWGFGVLSARTRFTDSGIYDMKCSAVRFFVGRVVCIDPEG